jgi:hypothetical protein
VSHKGTANSASRLRRLGSCLCLVFLFAALIGSSALLGGDRAPQKEGDKANPLAGVQILVRGTEEPMVGQRATIEVFLLNTGSTPLKDLEFHARCDAHMEQDSKERETTVAVDTIAPDDVQVVRLNVTPRKPGPGGIDFTLRAKNGATEQVRQVWPVFPEGGVRLPDRGQGLGALKIKVTPLKECYVDRPSIVLVNVINTDLRPMPAKVDVVISYAAMGRGTGGAGIELPSVMLEESEKTGRKFLRGGGELAVPPSTNPTRQAQVTVPVLAAGESRTLAIRITPRRIGDLGVAITATPKQGAQPETLATTRLKVKFDPRVPLEGLVPVRATVALPTRLPSKLEEVPEVSLEDPCPQNMKGDEAFEHVSALIEKINHVNFILADPKVVRDPFVETLVKARPDMRGLPFIMGEACRLSPERGQHFQAELVSLRSAMADPGNLQARMPVISAPAPEPATTARVAALVQVLGPEGKQVNQQAAKYLAALSHSEANKALARLAIFGEDEQLRRDATTALAKVDDKAVTDILVSGLNYPWPTVAQHAAEAIVQLKRTDLAPKLVDMLERQDPRAPQTIEKEGKQVPVVRELVRINHLRNCLLCHSPADAAKLTALQGGQGVLEGDIKRVEARGGRGPVVNGLTAPVPLPGQSLPVPTPQGTYGHFTVPDTLASFDVTYLRQDFSVKLPVANAQPWPETQRFDFLVRTREVTAQEAAAQRDLLRKAQDGDQTPYQRTALVSLRKLTGKDAEPTAAAWRQLLAQKPAEEKK